MPKGDIVEILIIERLVVVILVVIELLKYRFSLMSTLEWDVNKLHVKVK